MDEEADPSTPAGRLRLARERYDKNGVTFPSIRSAARHFGWNENTYKSHELGLRRKGGLPEEDARRYAKAFGVSLAWLMMGLEGATATADPDEARSVQILPHFLSVRFKVRAGLWEEIEYEEPIDEFDYAVGPNPRFADWPQWLELVVGDSVNMAIPEKHLAHVVDAVAMGYAAQQDDFVVVERRRDDGRTRERTIKQVALKDGKIELWPRSTNPKWSDPVELTSGCGGEDIEVHIVGLVIGSYNPTLLRRR